MNYLIVVFIFILSSCASLSKPTICEYLKLDNCNNSKRSLARSAGASLPSVNSAAFNNPAAIALNRGLGIESIHYDGYAQLGLITGSGRVGAAISNFPNDGSFFGSTAIESENEYRKRLINGKKFEDNKLVLAGAVNVFGAKSKTGLQMDLGLIYRRQTEVEKDYFGGGLIFSYAKFLSLGFSYYDDVMYSNLSGKEDTIVDEDGNESSIQYPTSISLITETNFSVQSYVAGLRFSKIALDYIHFDLNSNDTDINEVTVDIYNLSYFYRKWILSYGRRFESSFKEVYEDEKFIDQKEKSATFLGGQYATNNGLLLGLFWNYYLLYDLSLGLTYFF